MMTSWTIPVQCLVDWNRTATLSQAYGSEKTVETNVDLMFEKKHLDHAAHTKRVV